MSTLSAVSRSKHSEEALLEFLLSWSEKERTPLALWRLPGTDTKHMIISENCRPLPEEDLLEDLEPGFMMAPFNKNNPRFFLPADRFFSFEKGQLKIANTSNTAEDHSLQWLDEQLRPDVAEKTVPSTAPLLVDGAEKGKDAFIELIHRGIQQIERGNLEKIVPSRIRTITLPETFEVVQAFRRLCASYPEALISFVRIPGVGTWLGASPEILVSVHDKSIFKTVALAGTLPYQPDTDIKSVAWTQKEIEEQALVERYVISCFKKIRLREYAEHGPRTVVAGNLMHLKSEFEVDMNAADFPQLGSVMLGLLHPTSAVCGMPLSAALKFLEEGEGYERGFYAGYLGPVNVNQHIDLFVNLRCMQISGNRGILYAGAGVTMDSIPEKEWAETEIKFNTLLNVIL